MELTIPTNNILIIFAGLLLISVLATKFTSRLGLPALIFFIAVGMALGRFTDFRDVFIIQLVGTFALIIILLDGGTQTRFIAMKPIISSALSLATIGVFIATLVIGLSAFLLLKVSLEEGLLLGAIVSSTDAAAVFSVLGGKSIQNRITHTLEAESGSNDPMAVFLTLTLIDWIQHPAESLLGLILSFVLEMGVGFGSGLVLGWASLKLINHMKMESEGLYPVMAIACAVLTYGITAFIHGSGLLAVYIMALMLGNHKLASRQAILHFNKGFSWIMQIVMFILLGLLVSPTDLLPIILPGLALSMILMFLARPAGVMVSTLFSKFTLKEKSLISWAGLRGAIPIVLATYPLLAEIEHGRLIFNMVFFVVLTSALIQGATISPLAARLGLVEQTSENAHSLAELSSRSQERFEAIHLHIHAGMSILGRKVQELELPKDVVITAAMRGGSPLLPEDNFRFEEGDVLFLLASRAAQEQLRQIFHIQDPLSSEEFEPELNSDYTELGQLAAQDLKRNHSKRHS